MEEKKVIPNISNEKIEEAIHEYAQDRSKDNLTKVVNLLRPSGLYVPAMINEEKRPVPYFMKNSEGDEYLAVFTSKDQASEDVKRHAVMIMPFTMCNGLVSNDKFGLKGMVINPFSDNLILRTELVKKLHEADVELTERLKKTKKKMTPEQYQQYLRNHTEFAVLPERLYKEGGAFVEELCANKETAVAAAFDKGYPVDVKCPYSEKDFAVMALTIREDLTLVRVDMPAPKKGALNCIRIYMAWNPLQERAGYYTIESVPEQKGYKLGAIDAGGSHKDLGQAPVEGVELQQIIDMFSSEGTLN